MARMSRRIHAVKRNDPAPEQSLAQRRGLMLDVEPIGAKDPRASIAWEYATRLTRCLNARRSCDNVKTGV